MSLPTRAILWFCEITLSSSKLWCKIWYSFLWVNCFWTKTGKLCVLQEEYILSEVKNHNCNHLGLLNGYYWGHKLRFKAKLKTNLYWNHSKVTRLFFFLKREFLNQSSQFLLLLLTRGNGFKLKERILKLDIRRNFFTQRMMNSLAQAA